MIDEELKENWKAAYDQLKESLLNDEALKKLTLTPVIKSLAEKTHDLSDCFNELVETRREDGNLVPVIVGYFMAENVAHKLMGALTAGAIGNMSPGAHISHFQVHSQFAMTLWENAQKGWIDDFLKDTEST